MSDLISREEAIGVLETMTEIEEGIEMMYALPSIEAEPVVHGEWILDEYGNPHCSKCEHVQDAQTNYCSECGAEMSCMSKTFTPADIRKLQPELEAYRVQHIAEVTKMLKGIEELDKRVGGQNE